MARPRITLPILDAATLTAACRQVLSDARARVQELEALPIPAVTPESVLDGWDANAALLEDVVGPVAILNNVHPDKSVRDAAALLVDPRSKLYHGPATLKPLAAYFDGTLLVEDFATPDASAWEREAASLGAAQPLSRLQWLAGLLGGHGSLLPGHDPEGKYRLTKWPQTEREYPKHFRIATAMMKGPATIAEVAEASGVPQDEVADFINANLATGYAEFVPPAGPEPEPAAQKSAGGLFGRMRGR